MLKDLLMMILKNQRNWKKYNIRKKMKTKKNNQKLIQKKLQKYKMNQKKKSNNLLL